MLLNRVLQKILEAWIHSSRIYFPAVFPPVTNRLFRAPPYLPCGHSVSLLLWSDVEGWIWKPSATESHTETAEEEDKNMWKQTPLCSVM